MIEYFGSGTLADGVRTLQLFHDEATLAAIKRSHRPCEETGEWPSDHGVEAVALFVRSTTAAASSSWVLPVAVGAAVALAAVFLRRRGGW